ncbi:hypothetical protein QU38_01745, partial [Staphylococcus aureus]
MTAELARENGDVTAVWERLKETGLQITEWRGGGGGGGGAAAAGGGGLGLDVARGGGGVGGG